MLCSRLAFGMVFLEIAEMQQAIVMQQKKVCHRSNAVT